MKLPNLLLLMMILICVLALPSCAGWEFDVRGPYGTAKKVDEKIVIIPLPQGK